MSRLQQRYKKEIKQHLKEKFGFENPEMVPCVKKVVISMGLGEASKDKNSLQEAFNELMALSGQRPVYLRAKKAIANFKLRIGQPIGAMATLRGKRMYDFMDRFFNIASPRIRDFRGFSRKCDGRGSYSLGIEDQQIFAEVNLDKVKRTQGMNITFVTSAKNDEECIELLAKLGLPFKADAKADKLGNG